MIKSIKISKLTIVLIEYFGFSILCGFISFLFFKWSSRVIIYNYMISYGDFVTFTTEYWMTIVIIIACTIISIFVLLILFQRKFSYMLEISNGVEEMENGNLKITIPIVGDDELTDLAARINNLSKTIEKNYEYLEKIKKEQFQTVTTLSHDIRTPLTAVMSYLQLICDDNINDFDKLKLYAHKAYEKSFRIKEMTDTIFESCVMDIVKTSSIEKVDGNNFIEQAFFDIKDFLEQSGFVVEVNKLTTSTKFFININRKKISRIFDNIVSNIEKYADNNYPIKLDAIIQNNFLVLNQENIVISKYQKSNVESHLIGLKTVENIVKEINGTVNIYEKENIFSIKISIPII